MNMKPTPALAATLPRPASLLSALAPVAGAASSRSWGPTLFPARPHRGFARLEKLLVLAIGSYFAAPLLSLLP